MSNNRYIVAICLLLCCPSCAGEDPGMRQSAPRIDTPDISGVVITLPDAPGRELVERSCVPCHSLRYIEMQPAMPRESWEKIVAKMISAYGAPVRDSAAAAGIVDYLVKIKGM